MKKPPFLLLPLSALMCLLAGPVLGQGIVRLKDINTQAPATDAQNNDFIAVVNNTFFIASDDNLSGSELWKSDGTLAGTVLVKDIVPGTAGSSPKFLTAVGTGSAARLFFVANATGAAQGDKLWMSDGTATGTVEVTTPGDNGMHSPSKLIAVGDTLFFEGQFSGTGRELWKVNLGEGNAQMVREIAIGGSNANLQSMVNIGGTLYFVADDGDGADLWKSDGTEAGTVAVTTTALQPELLTAFEDQILFSALDTTENDTGRELWRSDGSTTAQLLFDVELSGSSDPQSLLAVDNWLYFTGEQVAQSRRLYRTDGISDNEGPITSASGDYSESSQLTPITLTPPAAAASKLILFSARDATTGMELWRSNGSSGGGTVRAADINGGGGDSNPSNFMILGPTTVLFTATSDAGLELWRCEGSTGILVVTKVLELPGLGDNDAIFRSPVVSNATGTPRLYFFLNHDEWWTSDGTAAGTLQIKRFRSGEATPFTAGSYPEGFMMHGAEAYFTADDGLTGRQIWKTTGTDAGTTRVTNLFPAGFNPLELTSAGADIFFTAVDSGEDRELFRINAGVPEKVKDIRVGPLGSSPENLLWSESHTLLFFAADDGAKGVELWRSDGTADGTFMVKDMRANAIHSNPEELVIFRDQLYYVGTSDSGREVLKSDGILDDIKILNLAGTVSSNPEFLTVMGPTKATSFLYFVATAGQGRELYKSDGVVNEDGSLPNTAPVKDIISGNLSSSPKDLTVSGRFIFFTAASRSSGDRNRELWKTDGTEAGTVLVKDIRVGDKSAFQENEPSQLVDVAGRVFFVADDGINGAELWVSNGAAGGTFMVANIVAGAGSPGIQDLTSVNGVAVFTADNGVNGREVWISDGTAAGTFMVRDLTNNDPSSSSPQHLFNFGERLLYSGATYISGQEPRIGDLVPEIAVEQPAGTPQASGATLNFGDCSIVNVKTLPILVRNDGLNTLKSIKVEITGLNAKEFTLVTKPAVTLGPDATVTLNVKFAPKAEGVRTAVMKITSTDPNEGTYLLNLTGTGEAVFTAQPTPASQLVQVGGSATFNVGVNMVGDAPPTIQWRKAAAAIPGALGEQYEIPSVTLGHAGLYTVQVKVGTAQAVSDKNSPAALHVVDNTTKTLVVKGGTSASFKVDFKVAQTTVKPTFEWWRKVGSNPEQNLTVLAVTDLRIKGANSATLKIDKPVGHESADSGDSGVYFCKVTAPGATGMETVEGGRTILNVFSSAPEIAEFEPPNSIVGANYEYQVLMNTAKNNIAPSGFTVKNLPAGTKMDAKSGRIAGRLTKAGTYDVIITASNAVGKNNPAGPGDDGRKTVVVADLPTNLAGTYVCLVERSTPLNLNMGGRLDLAVTGTGAYTGSLTLGTLKLPVKGDLEVSPTGAFLPRSTLTLKRPKDSNVTLFIEIDYANNSIGGNSQVNDNLNIAAINGWRQVWNSSTKVGVANPATGYLGYYTLGLRLSGGPSTLPQGWGYASFTVAKDGKLSVAGKTADGEGITCGTFVGPNGQVIVFQPLYMTTPKGSLLGQMTIGVSALADNPTDNTIGGALDWVRPEDTRKAASRVYKKGFGHTGMPVELDVLGSFYSPPVGEEIVMGIEDGFDNAELLMDHTEEALADSTQIPTWVTEMTWPPVLSIRANNKVSLPLTNVSKLKFTLTPGKGTFTGGFSLKDPNPRNIAPLEVPRSVTFQGLIINDGTESYGVGYYLNAELPSSGDPNAVPPVPATTPTTSPIYSGSVIFQERQP